MHQLTKAIEKALYDEALRKGLEKSTSVSIAKREQRVKEIPDFELLREKASRIKENTVKNIRILLKEFIFRAKSSGFQVHIAQTADEARRTIYEILREHHATTVIKSKSMTSEEIELNTFLESKGLSVYETDLGEFIIQIAGERPAHITAPALHKSRKEVAELFRKKLQYHGDDSPAHLTEFVRGFLRRVFLNADAGITGANFLVAKTGTIVVVENEGNARFTLTAPGLHIVLAGVDKLVNDWNDLYPLLRLLAPSATGQRQTSYVSFINKPLDREVHIVLLDNGRLEIAESPHFFQSLKCIRCGMCSLVCPVFQVIGGQSYLSPYSGPIGIVVSPLLNLPNHNVSLLPYLCTLCGRCVEVCPTKIDLVDLILKTRSNIGHTALPIIPKISVKAWKYMLNTKSVLPDSAQGLYEKILGLVLKWI